jgi:hypothetical protein
VLEELSPLSTQFELKFQTSKGPKSTTLAVPLLYHALPALEKYVLPGPGRSSQLQPLSLTKKQGAQGVTGYSPPITVDPFI